MEPSASGEPRSRSSEEERRAFALPGERSIPRLPGHPVFGHLQQFRNDRIGMLRALATDRRDIVEMPMGFVGRRLIVVTSPAIANEVLVSQASAFVKSPGLGIFFRPVLGDGLLTSESAEHASRNRLFGPPPDPPPTHERQRRLLSPAFAPKRVASYAALMAERAERFSEKLEDGESVDLSDRFMHLTFEIVAKTLLDADVTADADSVGEALTVAMQSAMGQLGSFIPVPPQIPTPGNLRYRRAVADLDEVVYRIIRERRAEGGDRGDVLSMLLSARDEDGTAMTDRQVRDETMTLVLAGHETIANALSWPFYLLDRHPHVRERMEAEVDALGRTPTFEDLRALPYTLAVLKESMRLYPPAYIVGRRNVRDLTVGGYPLKKNAIVLVNIVGIHQRSELWTTPHEFEPERFLGDLEKRLPRGAYMPFGAGPRICIGNHFALMEGHLLLATIARRARFELSSSEVELEPLVTLRPRRLRAKVSLRSR